jgi:hypothetical protein
MRIEELIRKNTNVRGIVGSEYIIRVLSDNNGELRIYVRPYNIDGETKDYIVKDNILYPIE